MGKVNQEIAMDAIAIRDTAVHEGSLTNLYDFQLKTIIIENNLNKDVTIQCLASPHSDFSSSFNVGSPFVIAANMSTYQTCDSFFPYMKLTAQCAESPTTGAITVHFLEYGV